MTREERLLLLLAQSERSEAERKTVSALLSAGVDWAELLRLARLHEIAPLVHRSVERLAPADVPTAVREALAAERRSMAARNGLSRISMGMSADYETAV